MKKATLIFLAIASLTGINAAAQTTIQKAEVSTDTLQKHVAELAAAVYEGRMAGTTGYNRATKYVIDRLRSYGVKPHNGEWLQWFETECNQIENCKFNSYYAGSDDKTVFILGNDFACAGMTGRGYADAQAVFCGYGIDNPAFDEYAHVDARGKIVIVVTGLPMPSWLPSTVTENYVSLRDKARTAQKHGAVALVAINMSRSCLPYEAQARIYNGGLPHLNTFPILQPTRICGERLLADEGWDIDTVLANMAASMKPQSFHLRKRLEIDVNAKYNPSALTANVVGILEGSDKKLRNEYVVVGAHLDHVGMQGETALFPGADDNASGVAAALEVARQLSQQRPKRSVVFVFFSAAENQYQGSQIFVSNFSPLRRIEAFINIEAVSSGDSLVVFGDNKYPTLWGIASNADTAGIRLMTHPATKSNPKGDAVAFDAIGIPSIVITTLNGRQHNHVPSDIAENIDRWILTQSTRLLLGTVREVAFGDYQGRSLRSRAYKF
ncbi:MAG: M20/M25/M40 family metallo-hydrolase [Bacteroidales bacterium]|nr:M20/M25/M40 family metallo-hydrolase [Bacteroidales bacterium]